ncbi:hypothetical protein ABD76_21555 [Paenibacillus dendritiformis]|nr:hypothetical protein [Paenibacillus dendritiformis]
MTNSPKLLHSTPEESKHVLHKWIEFIAKCVSNANSKRLNFAPIGCKHYYYKKDRNWPHPP